MTEPYTPVEKELGSDSLAGTVPARTPVEALAPRSVDVVFGAITEKLAAQLAKQGYGVTDADELTRIQLIADAVSVVTIQGMMSYSQSDKARDKLAKRLWKIVTRAVLPADGALPRQDMADVCSVLGVK